MKLPPFLKSFWVKLAGALVVLVLLLWLITKIESVGIWVGDFFAHRRITKLQEKIDAKTVEIDTATRNAERLEAQVEVLEAQTAVAEAAVKAAGQKAQRAQVAAEQESQKYDEEMRQLDTPVSDDVRRARIAVRLCELFPTSCARKPR